MNTSSYKFRLPNCTQLSLLTHWNKMYKGRLDSSLWAFFGFRLVPQSKTRNRRSEERNGGYEALEVKSASEQEQTSSISWCPAAAAHTEDHGRAVVRSLNSSCPGCTQLPALSCAKHILKTKSLLAHNQKNSLSKAARLQPQSLV